MTAYNRGDVILVPYPFGERASGRKRPALVVSPEEYNQATGELIIAQITGRQAAPTRKGDYSIQDWNEANLPPPATLRALPAPRTTPLVLSILAPPPADPSAGARMALSGLFSQ